MKVLSPFTLAYPIAEGGTFGFDRGPSHTPRFHQGADFRTPVGTPVLASGVGVVSTVQNTGTTTGFGLFVVVRYSWEEVLTAHLSRVDVVVGEKVNQTSQLGLTGGLKGSFGAGVASGPHCHVEHKLSGARLDPALMTTRGKPAQVQPALVNRAEVKPAPTKRKDTMQFIHSTGSNAGKGAAIAYSPGWVERLPQAVWNQRCEALGLPLGMPTQRVTDDRLHSFLHAEAGMPQEWDLEANARWSA